MTHIMNKGCYDVLDQGLGAQQQSGVSRRRSRPGEPCDYRARMALTSTSAPPQLALVVGVVLALAGCSDPETTTTPATVPGTVSATSPATSAAASTSTIAVTAATLPSDVLVAVPFRNRPDEAAGRFQLKLVNGSPDRLEVRHLRLVWPGVTTDVVVRDLVLVAGQRTDFPVPFPGARCAGDGTAATMPDIEAAIVEVGLAGGTTLQAPVADTRGVLRTMYLDDCRRQHVGAEVGVEWADLRAAEHEGRPVTEGVLRLTRRASTTTVAVRDIGSTINFTVQALGAPSSGPLLTMSPEMRSADLTVRFLEGRCDSHALSESSQPFSFVVDLDLGDGTTFASVLLPAEADRLPMRMRVEAGCAALGKIEILGQADETTPST
jgi:hypothetical protein